jgi:hypothetical protein
MNIYFFIYPNATFRLESLIDIVPNDCRFQERVARASTLF